MKRTLTACGSPQKAQNSNVVKMANCLQCGNEIPKPRKGKKFCNGKCRDAWHNAPKRRSQAEGFVKELIGLLKKYRFVEN
jgi:predicted nucleic acid-binding Zn ribbon protein